MKYFLSVEVISQLLTNLLPFKSVIAHSKPQHEVDNASNNENLTFSNGYSIAKNIEVSQKDTPINFINTCPVNVQENKESIFELMLNLKSDNFQRLVALLVISTILMVIILTAFILKYLFTINLIADGHKLSPVEHLVEFIAFVIYIQCFFEAFIATKTDNLSNKYIPLCFFTFYPFLIIFLILMLNIIFKLMFDLSNFLNSIICILFVFFLQSIFSGSMMGIIWYFGSKFETLSLKRVVISTFLFMIISYTSSLFIGFTLRIVFSDLLSANPRTGRDMKIFSLGFWKFFINNTINLAKKIGSKIISAFKIIINPRRYKILPNNNSDI